jgi:hypothetical protein
MKNFFSILIFPALLITTSLHAETRISKNKINGPECTTHLIKVLNIKPEEAYQICSSHSDEVKVCLIQNSKLSKKEILKKCHTK